ncbi:hypothetical protein [Haloarchaeobius amylolyticus]|uniref:hypothetical protein n=1 Tax=Haloarchaeobius amylolyticus TaxID=1198296 RepID=UPI00226E3063|nr:hypothetical protein [Haloarchaeobius amylolyticus]
MSVARRVGLTPERQGTLVHTLQAVMFGILSVGVWLGNAGVVVNAAVGLCVTFLPAYLERNYRFTMSVGLVLWITVAMFLHALGTLPLPGADLATLYGSTWWWDHMTHALSSSLVAGVAYAVARALDEHAEAIVLPPRFLFVYLLVFVMAFGVVWELLEFYISVLAGALGTGTVLTQYGLDDTLLDLGYNTLGGLLVALFGTAHLTGVAAELAGRLGDRADEG